MAGCPSPTCRNGSKIGAPESWSSGRTLARGSLCRNGTSSRTTPLIREFVVEALREEGWTAKDTWLGPEQNLGSIGALYNLTMDPFEKYDMVFNGAMSARMPPQSPGTYAGQDNGWAAALVFPVVMEFNKSIVEYPNIKRTLGGASNDWRPDLRRPDNPVPLLDMKNPPKVKTVPTVNHIRPY